MEDAQVLSFVLWSAITGMVLVVSALCYKAYAGRRRRGIAPA